MSEFDQARALRDELAGLADIELTIRRRERACEEQISNAERELNDIRKLRGFVRIQIEQKKRQLEQLERDR
jgi:hypothetical protein